MANKRATFTAPMKFLQETSKDDEASAITELPNISFSLRKGFRLNMSPLEINENDRLAREKTTIKNASANSSCHQIG